MVMNAINKNMSMISHNKLQQLREALYLSNQNNQYVNFLLFCYDKHLSDIGMSINTDPAVLHKDFRNFTTDFIDNLDGCYDLKKLIFTEMPSVDEIRIDNPNLLSQQERGNVTQTLRLMKTYCMQNEDSGDPMANILFHAIGKETLQIAVSQASRPERKLATTFVEQITHLFNYLLRAASQGKFGSELSQKEAKDCLREVLKTGKTLLAASSRFETVIRQRSTGAVPQAL